MEFKHPVCRGSWVLGTACGHCERCEHTRPVDFGRTMTATDVLVRREVAGIRMAVRVSIKNLEATELASLPSIAHVIKSLKAVLND